MPHALIAFLLETPSHRPGHFCDVDLIEMSLHFSGYHTITST